MCGVSHPGYGRSAVRYTTTPPKVVMMAKATISGARPQIAKQGGQREGGGARLGAGKDGAPVRCDHADDGGSHQDQREDLGGGQRAAGALQGAVLRRAWARNHSRLGVPGQVEAIASARASCRCCGNEDLLRAAGTRLCMGAQLRCRGLRPVAGDQGLADFVESGATKPAHASSFPSRRAIWRRARNNIKRMLGEARPVISAISRCE